MLYNLWPQVESVKLNLFCSKYLSVYGHVGHMMLKQANGGWETYQKGRLKVNWDNTVTLDTPYMFQEWVDIIETGWELHIFTFRFWSAQACASNFALDKEEKRMISVS